MNLCELLELMESNLALCQVAKLSSLQEKMALI